MSRGGGDLRHRSIGQRLIEEFRLFMVLFLYLWLLLGLFVLNETIADREHGNGFVFQGFAVINALVLAKIMLVVEHFDFARWLQRRPLILTILFEAIFCTGVFLAFHVIERLIVAVVHGNPITLDAVSVGGGGMLGLVIVVVILFVSLLPFFAFKNVARVIGPERMRQILLHRPRSLD